MLDDARCLLVFVDEDVAPLLEDAAGRVAPPFATLAFDSRSTTSDAYDRWLGTGDGVDVDVRIHPDDTAVLVYTSGTTGRPKGVCITHGALSGMRLCKHLEPAYTWTRTTSSSP